MTSPPPLHPLFKKVPSVNSLWFKAYFVSETCRYCRTRAFPPAGAHTSLSLSASALFNARRRGAALSVKHRYYVASLILHASIANITAQLLSLSYVYLILSDDGSIIRIFAQINILEGRAGYVVLMCRVSVTISYSFRCLTTETVKYTNENCFIENLAASKCSRPMWAQRGKQI